MDFFLKKVDNVMTVTNACNSWENILLDGPMQKYIKIGLFDINEKKKNCFDCGVSNLHKLDAKWSDLLC